MSKCQNPECNNDIADNRLKHNSKQQYCSRECFQEASTKRRRESGFYSMFSKAGNSAQAEFKRRTGKAPGIRGGARPSKK